MASIYTDVVTIAGGWNVGDDVRFAILQSLLTDAEHDRLDPFVSRERAFAAVSRARQHGRSQAA